VKKTPMEGAGSGTAQGLAQTQAVLPSSRHDEQFAAYLVQLRKLSLPAYILAGYYSTPQLAGDTLSLAFDPAMEWGRMACHHAQLPDMLDSFARAAETSDYAARKLRVGLLGVESGWVSTGSPFDPASESERQDSPAAGGSKSDLPSILVRKAGKVPTTQFSPDEVFTEIEEAQPEIVASPAKSRRDKHELGSDVESLGKQIDEVVSPIVAVENPATVEDVLELFGGRILED
jgi:hypothetical protein